jgi:hypothetical protein
MTILERIESKPLLLRLEERGNGTYIVCAAPARGDAPEVTALAEVACVLRTLNEGAGAVVRTMSRQCRHIEDENDIPLNECVDAIEFTPNLSFSCPILG